MVFQKSDSTDIWNRFGVRGTQLQLMCCATATPLSVILEIGELEYGQRSGPRRELKKDYELVELIF